MFIVASPNDMALCLRFEIFNLAIKQTVYQGLCDKVHYLSEFNVHELLRLAKPSLDQLNFELSPFRHHILCLQSVINTQRIVNKPPKEIKIVEPPKLRDQEVVIV